MRVFHRLEEIASQLNSCAVAIGNFDGVHLGHQSLLSQMMGESRRFGVPSAVLTFYPHPVEFLRPEKSRERLYTTEEKLAALETLGVEFTLVAAFNEKLAHLSPDQFFQNYLIQGLKAKSITVGFDFRFGKDRAGDTELLKSYCKKAGVELIVVSAFEKDSTKVSSSSIRAALRAGDVETSTKYLGRPYSITGMVSHGDSRGAGLGFPTANLKYPDEKLLPKDGVYVTRAVWQKQVFTSVTNVGVRPTFQHAEPIRTLEVHLLDFGARLYDETVKVEFLKRIRDERKFASVDDLKRQIQADVQYARDSFTKGV